SPNKPTTAMWLKAEIEKRGSLRYMINTVPHGDHWAGNAFFGAPVIAHEDVRTRTQKPIWLSMPLESAP
ncbi:MAG: hypothetical protein H8E48_07380, partial [Chloroflexi bacterium]|nr:hypothetical protein [Chloroflexota bacterium]